MRLWAGQLTMPGLVASHRSAAVLWRIQVLREELEFTDPQGTRRKRGAHVYWRPLPPAEVTVVGDLRVTTVARTLADLLRGGSREEALVALDSALSSRRYGGRCWRGPLIGGLDTVAAALDSPPVAGAARARRWLELADPGAGSPAETVARLRMRDAGLRPETQARILTQSGRLLRPDFFFRGEGVVVEIEGYAYHGTREAHRRDLARYNDLASCPEVRLVLRFGAEEIFNAPEAFVERVRAAVAGVGRAGGFGSPGWGGDRGRRVLGSVAVSAAVAGGSAGV
ncbi:endonuclease domain-containing protein [Streptomyces sp. NPDC054866]